MSDYRAAQRTPPDSILVDIADYVLGEQEFSDETYNTALYCLIDSLGCALLSLKYPACTKLLGPIVPDANLRSGARVPGTHYELDPVQAAFNIGAMIRWLDYNDTWLAAEWGHPSDNFGGILAVADYLARNQNKKISLRGVLTAAIKAYEIQGVLALENSFNRVGLDHVILVRIASTAVVTAMLGGNKQQIINAVSNAWIDGGALRTYRHAPNTGSRKSWAAGDATSRAVWHALMATKDEMGYPSVLSAGEWGFYDVLFNGRSFDLPQAFGSYVMDNILFKISFPAEFHAQTAVEAAMTLHQQIKHRLNDVDRIVIETQQAGARIIDKTGPLDNPADRDHCLQYMIAVPLLFGRLTADDYEDVVAKDGRIDTLRDKMQVQENPQFSIDYLDPKKRAIANAIQIFFKDGSHSDRVEVYYPVGHRRRREQGIPLLREKFSDNISSAFDQPHCDKIEQLVNNAKTSEGIMIEELLDLFIQN